MNMPGLDALKAKYAPGRAITYTSTAEREKILAEALNDMGTALRVIESLDNMLSGELARNDRLMAQLERLMGVLVQNQLERRTAV